MEHHVMSCNISLDNTMFTYINISNCFKYSNENILHHINSDNMLLVSN